MRERWDKTVTVSQIFFSLFTGCVINFICNAHTHTLTQVHTQALCLHRHIRRQCTQHKTARKSSPVARGEKKNVFGALLAVFHFDTSCISAPINVRPDQYHPRSIGFCFLAIAASWKSSGHILVLKPCGDLDNQTQQR